MINFICLVKGHALRYVPYVAPPGMNPRGDSDGMVCRVCGLTLKCDVRGCYVCQYVGDCEDYLRWGTYDD